MLEETIKNIVFEKTGRHLIYNFGDIGICQIIESNIPKCLHNTINIKKHCGGWKVSINNNILQFIILNGRESLYKGALRGVKLSSAIIKDSLSEADAPYIVPNLRDKKGDLLFIGSNKNKTLQGF